MSKTSVSTSVTSYRQLSLSCWRIDVLYVLWLCHVLLDFEQVSDGITLEVALLLVFCSSVVAGFIVCLEVIVLKRPHHFPCPEMQLISCYFHLVGFNNDQGT